MKTHNRRGERIVDYVEDSTKGKSLINPLSYKGDVMVQVWVDSRVLATLMRWLDKEGVFTRFMSQVVRRPLEVLADFVVENEGVERVEDTTEAREMLESRYGVKLNKGNRGSKNILHNTVLSAEKGALGERLGERGITNSQVPNKFRGIIDEALEIRRELHPKGEKDIDEFREEKKEFLESLPRESSGDEEVVFKEKMTHAEIDNKMREIEKGDEERRREEEEANNEFLESVRLMNERSGDE